MKYFTQRLGWRVFGLTAVVLCILSSCANDTDGGPPAGVNLVDNSSFEAGGQPSFRYWTGSNYDISHFTISSGGEYSLRIKKGIAPVFGQAQTFIAGFEGIYNYAFSLNLLTNNAEAHIELLKKGSEITPLLDTTVVTNGNWETIYVLKNISLLQSDSVFIRFSTSSDTHPSAKYYYVDNVKFLRQ